jgi:hypothetical protein
MELERLFRCLQQPTIGSYPVHIAIPISSRSVLILFYNLYPDYSNDAFPERFPSRLVYVFSICFLRIIYSTHIIRLDFIILVILDADHSGRAV